MNGFANVGSIFAGAFAVFARVLLQNPAFVPPFFERAAQHSTGRMSSDGSGAPLPPREETFLAFVDLWLENFERIGSRGARKLSGLALCNLFGLGLQAILTRLSEVIAAVTGIYFEVSSIMYGDAKRLESRLRTTYLCEKGGTVQWPG
jgi:hypothetical protein